MKSIAMRSLLWLVLPAAAWLGCSSSSPPVSSQSIDEDAGGGDAGNVTLNDGSTPGDAASEGDGSTTHDAGTSGDSGVLDDGGVVGPPPPASACDESATWGTGSLLSASTTQDDLLDSVTPDELNIAWTSGATGSKVVQYASRSTATDPFGAAQSLAANTYTADRVSLSPDGLRLVVVNADAHGFSNLSRASTADAFAAGDSGDLSNINAAVPTGASVGDPVVDASDTSFYYSLYDNGASTTTIYRSLRLTPNDPWGIGFALAVSSDLESQGSLRRRPTGISSDGRTLFFYDEVTSTERAGWINETSGSFDSFVSLGARTWAAPSGSCGKIYYSAAGTTTIDLFTATH